MLAWQLWGILIIAIVVSVTVVYTTPVDPATTPSKIEAPVTTPKGTLRMYTPRIIDRDPRVEDSGIVRRLRNLLKLLEIKNVIIWGHPLNSHTHSYVHDAFFTAAQRTGVYTQWVPQETYHVTKTIQPYDGPVDNCLFLTEGQVCDGMPESDKSWYIFHNVDQERTPFPNIDSSRILNLQFYHHGFDTIAHQVFDVFHRRVYEKNEVCMPWATNILPYEFYPLVDYMSKPNEIHIVGQDGPSYAEKISRFADASPQLKLVHRTAGVQNSEMIEIVRDAHCAPAIIMEFQKGCGYIPCRTFKNISYGQVSVTNSTNSDYILHHNTVYNVDEVKLAKRWASEYSVEDTRAKQIRAYNLVRQRHTYLNRWEFLLSSLLPSPAVSELDVVHLSCHQGCINYIAQISVDLQWKLTTINMLAEYGSSKVYNVTRKRADQLWDKYADVILRQSCVIVSDTAPLARIILQHMDVYKGHLIVWICNRHDYADKASLDEGEEFPDDEWTNMLIEASAVHSDRVRVFGYTKLERVYSIQKNVYWDGSFADTVVKPVSKYVPSLEPVESKLPLDKHEYVFIPPYINDEHLIDYDALISAGIKYFRGRYNGPDDLIGVRCILHVPYAASNLALFECLARGIVYYLPSETFMRFLLKKGPSWFQTLDNVFQYSEWYDTRMRHLYVYFDSWQDFADKLGRNEHGAKSKTCMEWAENEYKSNLELWSIVTRKWW